MTEQTGELVIYRLGNALGAIEEFCLESFMLNSLFRNVLKLLNKSSAAALTKNNLQPAIIEVSYSLNLRGLKEEFSHENYWTLLNSSMNINRFVNLFRNALLQ